jgi:hypothetical protein
MPTNRSAIASYAPPGVEMIERHGDVFVVRDDLLEGGSKSRFLPYIVPKQARELVFGAPFCGGAPVALAVEGRRRGIPVTIFYASRKRLTPRQQRVQKLGAKIEMVAPGYMTVVQARARRYAEMQGAHFYPLGFDVPEAEEPFIVQIRALLKEMSPPEIWCATGSGMLARCLALAMPRAKIMATAVGLPSRWQAQEFPSNVRIAPADMPFERKAPNVSPFPCCGHYDRKAWRLCAQRAKPGAVFWNVMGDE